MIRAIEESDVDEITRIYNQNADVNYELSAVPHENRLAWIKAHREPVTAWVYEASDRGVVGYCGLSPLSFRPSYKRVAEVALFVDAQQRSRINRVGAELLIHLVDMARNLGIRSLVANPMSSNLRSIAGCVVYGFKPAATLREAACRSNNWIDFLWLQKDLAQPDPRRYRDLKRDTAEQDGWRTTSEYHKFPSEPSDTGGSDLQRRKGERPAGKATDEVGALQDSGGGPVRRA